MVAMKDRESNRVVAQVVDEPNQVTLNEFVDPALSGEARLLPPAVHDRVVQRDVVGVRRVLHGPEHTPVVRECSVVAVDAEGYGRRVASGDESIGRPAGARRRRRGHDARVGRAIRRNRPSSRYAVQCRTGTAWTFPTSAVRPTA